MVKKKIKTQNKNMIKKSIKKDKIFLYSFFAILLLVILAYSIPTSSGNIAILKTNYGTIEIQLYGSDAPITVDNFKEYVKNNFYDNLIFHRVINGFMIQGGGFNIDGIQKKTNAPIKLESNNGLHNTKYTIAMARTNNPNSATSQFFINTNDNSFLDYTPTNPGYAVFGKVIKGTEIVDMIEQVKTTSKNHMADWPVEDIVILGVSLK